MSNLLTILQRDTWGDLKDGEYFDPEIELDDYLDNCATVDIEACVVNAYTLGCGVHARPGGNLIKHTHLDGSISYAIFYAGEEAE